jgi:hypothetical protein
MARPPITRAITNSVRSRGNAEPRDEIVNSAFPSEAIAGESSHAGADHASQKQTAGRNFGLGVVQSKLAFEEHDRAIDHGSIEAE